MHLIVFFVAALAAASASPFGFLQDTPEVQAAKQQFVREYNRMARLAAEAPDDVAPRKPSTNLATPSIPRRPNPVSHQSFYSFSANLGGNQQFFPQSQFRAPLQSNLLHSFPAQPVVHHQNVIRTPVKKPAPVAPVQTFQLPAGFQEAPIQRWTGPLADTVPAGVHGLPVQVTPTPEVQAARESHLRQLKAAFDAVYARNRL